MLSRDPEFRPEGAEVCGDVESLLKTAEEDAFVIGGGSVYAALLPWCDTVYVTRIDAAFPGADTWFPDLDADGAWERTEESGPLEQDGIVYRYVTYRRRA